MWTDGELRLEDCLILFGFEIEKTPLQNFRFVVSVKDGEIS